MEFGRDRLVGSVYTLGRTAPAARETVGDLWYERRHRDGTRFARVAERYGAFPAERASAPDLSPSTRPRGKP
ncbi:hypothetical protein ACWD3J_40620 [Streptomyces sp. NPDC002755]|uniref:hypothetical protein n=1 Tax=Streptomyces sp. NPDC002884 TaxID=3154544 RepID=UPI003326FC63